MTTEPQTTAGLADFVAALYGATHDPFRLTFGDVTEDVDDNLAPFEKAAGDEPIYLFSTTASGAVPFLYTLTEEPTDDAWSDMLAAGLAVRPTAILTKGRNVFSVYALTETIQADDPETIALAAAMGGALVDPLECPLPTPGANGWTLAHFDKAHHTAFEALADAFLTATAPAVVATTSQPASGLGRYKDATIRTVFDFEDLRLAEPVVVTGGKNRKSVDWKPRETTRADVLDIFCRHNVSAEKDGPAVVLGRMKPGRRLLESVEAMHLVGLDFDSGIDGDVLAEAIANTGLMAVMASTHSHLKTTTVESLSSIHNWLTENGREGEEVTQAVVRERMAEKGLEPEIVASMEIEIVGEGDDQDVVITHAPIQKWRVIFPLSAPFVIADHATDDEAGHEVWRRVPRALARRLGGLPFDAACTDVNRLWYLPAHPEGAEFRADLFGGDLLDVAEVLAQAGDLADDDVEQPRKVAGRRRVDPDKVVTGPFDRRWAARRADGLDIVNLLEDRLKGTPNAKKLRGWSDGRKKRIIECPFNSGHSNPRDKTDSGCFASNAGDGKGDGFTIHCSHGSCKSKGRDRLDFLNKMVEDGWFTAEDVEAFDVVLRDEPVVEPEVDVEAALAEYAGVHDLTSRPAKSKPTATTGYPLPKAAGKFELTEVDGRKFFAFPPDDEGKGGGLAFSRWTLVGGAIHPDRAGLRDLEIAFENEAGHRETFRIPADKAANKAYAIGVMRGQGIAFGSAQGETVAHRILMMTQPTNQIVRDRTGWLEDGTFMLPTGAVVGAPADVDVRLSDIKRIEAAPTAGTLDAWKEGAAAACNSASPSLHAGLLAGFAGPLTGLTGQATLVLAFTGTTTEGKTWRQQVGVAVSGPPEPGVGQMKSMNATIGALEVPLERGSCTIAAFDELHHAEAADVQNLIFRASGQQGRARLSQSGAAGLTRAWKGGVVTLSTETGLAQRLRQAGETLAGGTTVRLVEVDVTVNRLGAGEWERADVMLKNYGHALPVFIEEVRRLGYVDKPSALSKRVREFVESLEGTDTPVAVRAATAVGYLCVAGEIAKGAGLLPTSFDFEAVGRTLWEGALGSEMRAEDPIDRAIETLMESINARRHEIADAAEDRNPNREIMAWVSDYHGVPVYCVRGKVLSKWAGGAADERVLKKALLDRCLAIPYVRSKTVGGKTKTTETAIWPKWKAPVGMSGVMVIRASAVDGTDSRPHA
nr:DUF927 domain-containing protein [Brevundimonas diminuta]